MLLNSSIVYQYSFEIAWWTEMLNFVCWLVIGLTEVEPKGLSWQLYLNYAARGQNCVGMGWNRTDASNTSPIMARFWYIMDGIEKEKKKKEEELCKLIELYNKMHKNALLSHRILRGIFFLALWNHIVQCKFLHAILYNNIPSCNCKW